MLALANKGPVPNAIGPGRKGANNELYCPHGQRQNQHQSPNRIAGDHR